MANSTSIADIPVDRIRPNPFNSRLAYTSASIERLSSSISEKGQLAIVKVRPHPTQEGFYQLVFGHRRYYAAKKLGKETIVAEIVALSDEEMVEQSLVENIERDSVSDYELAMVFQKLNRDFHKTYDEIGKIIGVSRQVVSNHVAMLRLFDPEELSTDPELARALGQLTEHHARILSRVEDRSTRRDLAKMIARKKISVRELSNMVTHLRSWFQDRTIDTGAPETLGAVPSAGKGSYDEACASRRISEVIRDYLKFAHEGNSEAFMRLHLFGERFSMYDDVPPYDRLDRDHALSKKQEWVSSVAPELAYRICDEKIDVLRHTALATLGVAYGGKLGGRFVEFKVRGTLVFVDRNGQWKIFHEHWSRMGEEKRKLAIRSAIINLQKRAR